MRVSTGSATVPRALGLLNVVHDDLANADVAVRHLDRRILGGLPESFGQRLRAQNHDLWSTTQHLAMVHAQILAADGRLDESAKARLSPYLGREPLPDDGRHDYRDGVAALADGVLETSRRNSAFWGALGVWAAKGGSFSDAYRRKYKEISDDTASVTPIIRGGTEVALGVIFKPVQVIVDLANMPSDVRERYDAASLRLRTTEARATSAAVATTIREGIGKITDGVLPKNVSGKAASYLAGASGDEQEAFARGIGDLYGARVDDESGHRGSLDKVMSAIREGEYGAVLRETIGHPEDLQTLIGVVAPVEATVVPGLPSDRDRPAHRPHETMA